MKILGHPIHVILIHFPSALFPMDLVCSVLANCYNRPGLSEAAFYASVGGVIFGCLAVITGAFDLLPVVKDKPGSVNKALIHGSVNTTVLIGFTIFTFISYKHFPEIPYDSTLKLVIKGILVLLLAIGNFLGGSLILKDKIGVEK
jgi:uncharacterized membrane protein